MAGKSQKPVLVDQLALPAFRWLLSHEQQEIVFVLAGLTLAKKGLL